MHRGCMERKREIGSKNKKERQGGKKEEQIAKAHWAYLLCVCHSTITLRSGVMSLYTLKMSCDRDGEKERVSACFGIKS